MTSIILCDQLQHWQKTKQDYIVLFTTKDGSGPGVRPQISKNNPQTYIPNSVFFDLDNAFSDSSSELSTTMVSGEVFARQASLLGIKNTDTIVVYDDYGNFYSSRLWFMFKSMGHKHVYVLDGGLPNWLENGYETIHKLQTIKEHSDYKVFPDDKFQFVDKHFVMDVVRQNQLGNYDTCILDARSLARFQGLEKENKANLRSGHIPYSYSLHYATLQEKYGQFKDVESLGALFDLYSNRQLLLTCGSGVTACILAQAADFLGYSHLKVYDGSWSDWGSDLSFPVQSN